MFRHLNAHRQGALEGLDLISTPLLRVIWIQSEFRKEQGEKEPNMEFLVTKVTIISVCNHSKCLGTTMVVGERSTQRNATLLPTER